MSTAELTEHVTRLPAELESLLVCPRCKCRLELSRQECKCTYPGCGLIYPMRRQVPVLINETNSMFSIAGVLRGEDKPFRQPSGALRQTLSRVAPSLSANVASAGNYHTFAREVLSLARPARVLVIGSRVPGSGMDVLADYPEIQLIESDVELGPRPAVILDAHDIPFEDDTFDGVIAQAVLEHVADPQRCVAEIERVLKPHGLIYAETPFMQQVHEGAYDFTRFTYLGHRRLWRDFEEIDSGIACGPGMALAWSWRYFLTSFARRRWTAHASGRRGPRHRLLLEVFRSLAGPAAGGLRRGLGLLFHRPPERTPPLGPAVGPSLSRLRAVARRPNCRVLSHSR